MNRLPGKHINIYLHEIWSISTSNRALTRTYGLPWWKAAEENSRITCRSTVAKPCPGAVSHTVIRSYRMMKFSWGKHDLFSNCGDKVSEKEFGNCNCLSKPLVHSILIHSYPTKNLVGKIIWGLGFGFAGCKYLLQTVWDQMIVVNASVTSLARIGNHSKNQGFHKIFHIFRRLNNAKVSK